MNMIEGNVRIGTADNTFTSKLFVKNTAGVGIRGESETSSIGVQGVCKWYWCMG